MEGNLIHSFDPWVILVKEYDPEIEFYTNILGLEITLDEKGPQNRRFVQLNFPETKGGGIWLSELPPLIEVDGFLLP